MEKIFRAYYVWPSFPSVSMSGTTCALHCKHCNHTYLHDMQNVSNNQDLLQTAYHFSKNNAVGFLLSGGCNQQGEMLNLKRLLPTIKKIKQETDLIIKLHCGMVDAQLAEEIAAAEIDIASVEVVGSNETIQEIFGFNATIDDYTQTLQNLEKAQVPYIVPHVCIGLHYGKLLGEETALNIINESCTPSSLVMIIFRPTKGTLLEHQPTATPQDISKIITTAHTLFPTIDISLGCIRPRTHQRTEIELAALHAGATRMEVPSKQTLYAAQQLGYQIKNIYACCALPTDLEYQAEQPSSLHAHGNP